MLPSTIEDWLRIIYVVFSFFAALCLGAVKSVLVGPVAAVILIFGNVGVILGLLPSHVYWTFYTLIKTQKFDAYLKVALVFALPALFAIWVGLSIAGSVLVGVGYGFFTPWVSSFEAFRHDHENAYLMFFHCVVDGTWGTIKGSCTVVRDFADMCIHSYPVYLKELRESPYTNEYKPLRLIHVPGCIIVGIMGLVVEIPLFTAIAIVKSPYLLFKGWQRLVHDLISREGPFLETACIPIAGLTILMWPIIVIGSIIMAIFSSFFIGLYGAVIVYQERSFQRGLAYVIAMVAEFDEYTNDWLYLREGSILPKPRYRKKLSSLDPSVGAHSADGPRIGSVIREAPPILMASLSSRRSVRETIHEVKMVQVWGNMMRSCEMRGKELLDAHVITVTDLCDWLKAKNSKEAGIVGVGVPCYTLFHNILYSIKAGSEGLLILDDVEITHLNRPEDKMIDWFFQPLMVLKEQIKCMEENEVKYMEKIILFGTNPQRLQAWDNGSVVPQNAVRVAQLEGIARRMVGMVRRISMFPTYRRRYRHIVKSLIAGKESCAPKEGSFRSTKEGSIKSISTRSSNSIEIV
ncbi:hypothetical protein DCAR_0729562 [Daucus carota subsp. sativus]|uniref:Uncharacterized protein n=1 Tax=Daucus carota subsp. sativus TaxID=79200 RepID=A0A161X821_DAUCS|nr:PREDICTED: uncharacterized membrane protein At3g27390 [Daucus carota subsp. sativus]WOH10101.1 hypothetical protein DCAR_0729562 [Daucus carota subsp. sativus]